VLGRIPLATTQERLMRINWVFGSQWTPDPTINLDQLLDIAPSWGSWRTWRACGTNNVICHDPSQARRLLDRKFQTQCNLYLPRQHFQELGRPSGVQLYDGNYTEYITDLEDIIALHLTGSGSELVLITGISLVTPASTDRLELVYQRNRLGLIHAVIKNHPHVQWIMVDHPDPLDQSFLAFDNITCDKLQNVLNLLS
jgi:hypothetical protein